MMILTTTRSVVGIDLSMTCPAMCVHTGDTWKLSNCRFFYLTARKKSVIHTDQFVGALHSDFSTPEERFDSITKFLIDNIPSSADIAIEGYSYASVGSRTFQIGELCGVLKHKLYQHKYDIMSVAPTTVKKFAGKGNFSKLQMNAAFEAETGYNISKTLNCETADSPSSDVIDAYYICKYQFHNKNK